MPAKPRPKSPRPPGMPPRPRSGNVTHMRPRTGALDDDMPMFPFMGGRDEPDDDMGRAPGPKAYMRGLLITIGFGSVLWGVLSLLGHTYVLLLIEAAGVMTWSAIFGVAWARWHRADESARLYRTLRPLADLPRKMSKRAWRVNKWSGLEPSDVTLRPGDKFSWEDPKAIAKVVDRFAHALNADPALVKSERGKRGKIHLYVSKDAPAAVTDVLAPTEPDRTVVTGRVRDALAAVLDENVTVQVTDTHADGSPAAGVLTYPAKATQKARTVRGELPVVMSDASRPKSENGRWRFTWEPDRDRFLFVDEPDRLAPVVYPVPVVDEPDLIRGPVIGITETGDEFRIPILYNHIAIVGESASGKGSFLWGIIRGLLPLILDDRCLLYVSDPKGGMELGDLRPLCHRFALADGTAKMLEEAVSDMEAQARRIAKMPKVRRLETPTVENPLRLVIVDEITSAVSYDQANITHLSTLLAQGRAPGVVVIGALQDPRVKRIDVRNLFLYMIALRQGDPRFVDMVLGSGRRAGGATADLIPQTLPGVAYVISKDMPDAARVRAAYVTDDEIARITEVEQPAIEPPKPTRHRGPHGVKVAILEEGARVILPNSDEPVTIISSEPEGDDEYLIEYVTDSKKWHETQTFDGSDLATPC